jgi:hypothetical protein
MIDNKLAGARLMRFEYGLVADLKHENSYTSQYYFMMAFVRGKNVFWEYFPVNDQPKYPDLSYLGKIVKHKIETDQQLTLVFTDKTFIVVGDVTEEEQQLPQSQHFLDSQG